ncbi:MAG: CDP-alcohol phosphatidyltransferase family protein [Myxococcales bacterium]|nr:CDP-alcohol phosphatidyltransferase family protein [Myxococcales bacterium]
MSSSDKPFQAERSTQFDHMLLKYVIEPIWRLIPRSVTPNSITLLTPVFAGVSFILAASAPEMSPTAALLARVFAGVCMFCSMITDHLDGMHARRTRQTSRLGEVLDHALDAIHIPLASAGVAMTLGASPGLVMLIIVTNAMVYNAQLIVYHHTRKFVFPPSGGASTQVLLASAYVSLGVFLYLFPAELAWVSIVLTLLAWSIVFVQSRQILFFVPYLRGWSGHLLRFTAKAAGVATLCMWGALGTTLAATLLVLLSFRITGSYVLFTVVNRPYDGVDRGLIFGLAAIAATHAPVAMGVSTLDLSSYLALALCGYLVARNLADVARFLPELTGKRRAA